MPRRIHADEAPHEPNACAPRLARFCGFTASDRPRLVPHCFRRGPTRRADPLRGFRAWFATPRAVQRVRFIRPVTAMTLVYSKNALDSAGVYPSIRRKPLRDAPQATRDLQRGPILPRWRRAGVTARPQMSSDHGEIHLRS